MRFKPQIWLLLSLLSIAISWLYMHRILVPWEQYFNVEAGTMKAALGDLYSPWYGTRALLHEKKNPYGPEVTHEIQMAFYGRDVVQPSAPGARMIDEQRFAYPVYVVFLLAPAANMDFDTAHAWAPVILVLAVIGTVLLWMSSLRWRVSAVKATAIALFILASPQIAQGLRLRQIGLVVALLLALATWLLQRNYGLAAGVVLSVATIKPQMAVLPIAWFLIWSFADLPKRWRLPAGFFASLALLIAAGEAVLTGWPHDFLAGLVAYRRYGPVRTLLQVVVGNWLGITISTILIAGLLAWAWARRQHTADSAEFARTMSAFFIVAAVALPLMPPFNQALLILPTLMIIRDWATLPTAARVVFSACVSWPWLASLAMLCFPPPTRSLVALPLLPSALVLLFPPLLLLWLVMPRTPAMQRFHSNPKSDTM